MEFYGKYYEKQYSRSDRRGRAFLYASHQDKLKTVTQAEHVGIEADIGTFDV